MIIVVNHSGLGNRIKNVVSALRKGHLRNDAVAIGFEYRHLFQYAQCVLTPKPEKEISNTWALEILPEDAGRKILRTPNEFVILHDHAQIVRLKNHIDFQYANIDDEVREEFLRYFSLLMINPDVSATVNAFSDQHGIEDCVGVHIRSWIDEPTRHKLLHDIGLFVRAMEQHPRSRFYVSSDHHLVVTQLEQAFPGRVISRPLTHIRHVSHDNSNVVSTDAWIDMLILSRCRELIGTYESTFSECAWWLGGAKKPVTIPVPSAIERMMLSGNAA